MNVRKVPAVFAEAFAMSGRERHRLLAKIWRDVYSAELGTDLDSIDREEIRAWCRDTDAGGFAELLRVAYRHGFADGAKAGPR